MVKREGMKSLISCLGWFAVGVKRVHRFPSDQWYRSANKWARRGLKSDLTLSQAAIPQIGMDPP